MVVDAERQRAEVPHMNERDGVLSSVPIPLLKSVFFRQQSELLREIHSGVMVFLIHNIVPDDGHLRPADATGKISLLPCETRVTLFFHPSRRVSFQHLDCFCDPEDSAQVDVSMIGETPDGHRVDAVALGNACHICP